MSVRVLFAYADEFPEAMRAAREAWPATEFHRLTTDTAYFELLEGAWSKGDELILLEQDIVIRPGVVDDLLACPSHRCGYVYKLQGGFNAAWGCAKFSARLQEHTAGIWEYLIAYPEEIPFYAANTDPRHWFILDSRWGFIAETVYHLGASCAHWPPVVHLKTEYAEVDPYTDVLGAPTPAPHHCWKGHPCRCIFHGDGHACPIRTSPGGTSGGWAHKAGVLDG